MDLNAQSTTLKIKLSETLLGQFKSRVAAQNLSRDEYVSLTLHYGLQESDGLDSLQAATSAETPDVYLSARIPSELRVSLTECSDRLGYNAASFCGLLFARHFERHERDPRDLVVLYPIDRALKDEGTLAETELQALLKRHRTQLLAGVSPAFMANWFFNRFRSRIKQIETPDAETPFSPGYMKDLLEKIANPG